VYGMSEKLGNISFYESNNPYYGSPGVDKKYGEETARLIDREVMSIIEDARMRVMTLLTENRDKLEKLASELLLKEMLQYPQVEEILGKRAEGLFPTMHLEDAAETDTLLEVSESDGNTTQNNGNEQLTDQERAELEEAVARLKQTRNLPENWYDVWWFESDVRRRK